MPPGLAPSSNSSSMSTLEMNAANKQNNENASLSLHGETSAKGTVTSNNSEAFTHASISASTAQSDCPYPALNSNVIHQRRRVNPESLALRLGPDLVRDLDALIFPGNTEMPSFAVRKELQERYNIDRRHIYDYFHSRGLRVVKEDKHGNVVAPTEPVPTPLPNLRRVRQQHLNSLPSHPSHAPMSGSKWVAPKPRGITKAKPGRPKRSLPANTKIVPTICETSETKVVNEAVTEHTPALPTATYVVVNPLLPLSLPQMEEEDEYLTFNSIENPLDESFSIARAIGDIAYSYRHTLVFQRMQELHEYPIKSTFSDDSPLSYNETSPCSVSDRALLLPHVKALATNERQAIYKTLSESLGPLRGIQEYQGTYRKYMEGRTKLYFEGLLSDHAQQPSKTNTSADRKPALDTNEFRHWLSEINFPERDGINGASRLHHNHRNTSVTKPHAADISTDKSFGQRPPPHWTQRLDDLFPPPARTLESGLDITDSPVVRTRELPCMAPHFSSDWLGDESSEGDQSPLSGVFSPTKPTLLQASLSEAGQKCRTQFHGLAGFPRPQEVTHHVPAVDLGDPQKSKHSQSSHRSVVGTPGIRIVQGSPQNEPLRKTRMAQHNDARTRFAPYSPITRDRDRIKTRSITSRDARRRTPSAAGGI